MQGYDASRVKLTTTNSRDRKGASDLVPGDITVFLGEVGLGWSGVAMGTKR